MRIFNDKKNRHDGELKPELELRMDTVLLDKGKDSLNKSKWHDIRI